jgi:hypothetical protein
MPAAFMRYKSINYYSGPETPIAEIREQFSQSEGGSVDLIKNEDTGIATVCLNQPERRNAINGNNNSNKNNRSSYEQGCGVGVRRNFGGVRVSKNAPTPTSI